ncbi:MULTISPECIES: MBL fold metallo-hydrolase [unclassified Bacillus (in: firmicutes)]|uniref:MBL fold metallo-hydrolase n=1 Tax=unclassified Bacillus (in: firmicutes) TaxID=185979 RepID=UPI0008E29A2B|nr:MULTISPECIES: MBL fold metallo-hydrolase [unclassified Bacillus (in: firmicutes)]SFA97389.1 Glyoxylase, beta-lactamase superfamily II [Bacillus sp. UNCCL13]SFQ80472.1 Glyoxylase, beta-lactamase superfamily II [Bacillus sp. cl95]
MTEWQNGIAKITLPTPFAVGDVNVYLVKGERLTLIDAGTKTEESWEAFKSQLGELGLTPEDIEQVVLTHHHPDHVGMLDYLPDSLEVYGHYINERWINRSEEFLEEHNRFFHAIFAEFGIPDQFLPFIKQSRRILRYSCHRPLTGELKEGDRPLGMSDWEVIETPGHAQSHIALFRESDGVLIGGDHIIAHISPNPLIEPPLPGETERPKSQLQYNASLKKVLNYPIELVYSGHGKEVFNLNPLIEKRLLKQHDRAMGVKQMLATEPLTVFQVCQRLFPTVYERELSLTISETVAQFDYLLSLGEIEMVTEHQPYLYRAR